MRKAFDARVLGSAAALVLAGLSTAFAADAEWSLSGAFPSPADWQTPGNWTTGNGTPLPPSGAGVFALVSTDITAAPTIQLNSTAATNVTLGRLDIGDTNGTHGFNIAAGLPGNLLVFNNNGTGAQLNPLATTGSDTISAGIRLDDNLTVVGSGGVLTLSGPITSTGIRNLTLTANAGNFVLSGLVNHSGSITNNGVFLSGGNNVQLTGGVGSNVTGITQNSDNSGIGITGTLTVNAGGTTLTNNGKRSLSVLTADGTGDLILTNNALVANPVLGINGATNITGKIVSNGVGFVGARTTLAGVIGSTVTGIIHDSATANLFITGANTSFTGGVTLKQGILDVQTNGSALGTGALTLGDSTPGNTKNATLRVGTGLTITTPINVVGGGSGTLMIGNSAGSPFVDSPITLLNGNVLLANLVSSTSTSYRGGVTGTGNVSVGATGGGMTISTMPLNHNGLIIGATTGAGTVNITGGVGSNVTGITQAGTGNGLLQITTTALTLNASGTTLANTTGKVFNITGGINGSGDLILKNNAAAGSAIVLSTVAIGHTGQIINSGSGVIGNTISASIASSVTGITQDSGTSKLLISGDNGQVGGFATGTAPVQIGAGTLQIGHANALGTGNVVSIAPSGILDLNNLNPTIAGLNDSVGGGTVTNTGANARVLALGGTGAYAFSGTLTASTLNRLSINKSGSGTQTISGNGNNYAGGTTVNAGTLLLTNTSGSATGTGAITVAAAGTLGGNGFVATAGNASVTVSGKLAPGTSPGTLTMDLGTGALNITTAVTPAASQSMLFDIGAPGASDKIALSGTTVLTIGAGQLAFDDFVFTAAPGIEIGTYTLFDSNINISGSLSSLPGALAGTFGGGFIEANIAFGDSNHDIVLNVTAVPEPASLALLSLGAISFLRRRRHA